MISISWKVFFSIFFVLCRIYTTNCQGINLTGIEQTWNSKGISGSHDYKKDLQLISASGIKHIRLPVDLSYFIENAGKDESKRFKKEIKRIIGFTSQHKMSLILSNFNQDLDLQNYQNQGIRIAENWLELLNFLEMNDLLFNELYLDIVNEPVLYPKEWEETAKSIITYIRKSYPEVNIIFGASNYNSIYELSRMQPLPFESIIYSFHFYEPFIFTHQGTSWTGDQNTTTGIPFPYPDSTQVTQMPLLAENAKGTAGAINFRDYSQTGTYQAIRDKLSLVKNWKNIHGVELWCTEYGVTRNADEDSRIAYLKAVDKVLNEFGIRGYIWEYRGNFGIDDLPISTIFNH